MRVLLWSESFWPAIGGVQVFIAKLALALRERHVEVTVVTSQYNDDLPHEAQYNGIPVHRFPFWSALADTNIDQLIRVSKRVAQFKRAFAPDLVHMNSCGPSVFFHLHTAGAHPAPLLVTLHANVTDRAVGHHTVLGQTLRSADWVTANSAAVLGEVRELVPEITSYSSLIYYGLDVPALSPGPPPSGSQRLLCLGRLVEDKGFDLALAAFTSVRDRFPHARLVIAGDGPARPELEQQAADLGLSQFVNFVGWVSPDKVPELMSTATLVVMPSRWEEAFGLVALEAALMARPIVATRVGGLPEAVLHQETGLLVEKESSKALGEAIAFLLEHPDRAVRMGLAGRQRAQKLFGWNRCVDNYVALYRKLNKEAAHVDPAESPVPQ